MKAFKEITKITLSVAVLLAMTACSSGGDGGGGGDDDASNPDSNTAPTANAGVDQNIHTSTLVTLDGSKSTDAEGDTLSYKWVLSTQPANAGATLSSGTVLNPTFTPSLDGAYTFSLIVNDGTVDSTADTIVVTATTANAAPVANAGVDQVTHKDEIVTLNGSATDADGDSLTYSWSVVAPAGSSAALSSATAIAPTFTPDVEGTYTFSLVANDGTANSTADEMVLSAVSQAFITTWKTDNPSNRVGNTDKSIFISTAGEMGTFTVDWGDSSPVETFTAASDPKHDYAIVGTYTVKIRGDFPRTYFNWKGEEDSEKLLSVENWGNNQWTTMERALANCPNLVITAIDAPNLSNVMSMAFMFSGSSNFNSPIGDWNVSNVKDMSDMFYEAHVFNQDISNWDTSSVTEMMSMFYYAESFDQNIANWDVSQVKSMEETFYGAVVFDQDIGDWNTSNVIDMSYMFYDASAFNQDISRWETSQVDNMSDMFEYAYKFDQPIGSWDTSSVTDMSNMFFGAKVFNQDISNWDTGIVTTMDDMFAGAILFNQNLGSWDVSALANATNMFERITLSTANYESLLEGWAAQTLQKSVTFSGGNSVYYEGSVADTARFNMIVADSWSITDGGAIPIAPSGLNIVVGKGTTLDWTDNSSVELNFVVEMSDTKYFGRFVEIARTNTDIITTGKLDHSSWHGTLYFRVKATNNRGDSKYSKSVSHTY